MYNCGCGNPYYQQPCAPVVLPTPSVPATPATTVPGGWSSWHCLTCPEKTIFFQAISGLVGANYKPCFVQSQVVSGTNYNFFARKEVVNGTTCTLSLVLVSVFVDLQQNVTLGTITNIGN